MAAGQGSAAAAEFQKILDHSGIVWNCWTGALARLGVARANGLQAKTSQGADSDAARVRDLAAYKDFLALWKDADPKHPHPEGSQSGIRKAAITFRTWASKMAPNRIDVEKSSYHHLSQVEIRGDNPNSP